MIVWHAARYLTRPPEPRTEEYFSTIQARNAVKGDRVNNKIRIKTLNTDIVFPSNDVVSFTKFIDSKMAGKITQEISGEFSIIPLPGHKVVEAFSTTFRNYETATRLARNLGDWCRVASCLHWHEEQPAQHTLSGPRNWQSRHEAMRIGTLPKCRVVLFDDVFTSGSTLLAARKHLLDAGHEVLAAFTVLKAIKEGEPGFGWQSEELWEAADMFQPLE
jgi:hypothetical protein